MHKDLEKLFNRTSFWLNVASSRITTERFSIHESYSELEFGFNLTNDLAFNAFNILKIIKVDKDFTRRINYILNFSLLKKDLKTLNSFRKKEINTFNSFLFVMFFYRKIKIKIKGFSSDSRDHRIIVYGKPFCLVGNADQFNRQFLSERVILLEKRLFSF